jgi:hypothetical protein
MPTVLEVNAHVLQKFHAPSDNSPHPLGRADQLSINIFGSHICDDSKQNN